MLPLYLALGALGVLVYTYVGYPVLLAALARLFPQRVLPDDDFEPPVTVCLSAYNAGAFIDRKLASTLDLDYPSNKLQVLVYSDGSTDDTEARVLAWQARDPRVKLLRGETRQGKPHALNRMAEVAEGEVLFLTDVRQTFNRGALRSLMRLLGDPSVGCVSGNLVLEGETGGGAYWRYENWIRRKESRFRSVVGMSGSIAVVRRKDMAPLPGDTILDDVWIPMRLRLRGRKVLFCEEALAFDQAFDDEREFGRKVRTLAGNYQLFARMPQLLMPGLNPLWFETVSHKVLRLVCPFALVALLLASAVGSLAGTFAPLWRSLFHLGLLGQVAFYCLAYGGERLGRLGRLARTFVVLNAAAVMGLVRFATGRQKITW